MDNICKNMDEKAEDVIREVEYVIYKAKICEGDGKFIRVIQIMMAK